MPKYEVGQRWTYQTREQDTGGSTLLIGSVQRQAGQDVIHIKVENVGPLNSNGPSVVSHMPFSQAAMDASVVSLVESQADVGDDFQEGIATWKEQAGGVFEISVAEAIEAVFSVAAQPDDTFDELVVEMRSTRSSELIGKLHRQLFALPQWFFLSDPENDRAPVQWQFADGANTKPALLAFTNEERAATAAVELGLYPEGTGIPIMPAPVREAAKWFSGPDCANEWICFNLTYEDFPLQSDEAVQFLRSK